MSYAAKLYSFSLLHKEKYEDVVMSFRTKECACLHVHQLNVDDVLMESSKAKDLSAVIRLCIKLVSDNTNADIN